MFVNVMIYFILKGKSCYSCRKFKVVKLAENKEVITHSILIVSYSYLITTAREK